MLGKGLLASRAFYPTQARREEHTKFYLGTEREAFIMIAEALKSNHLMSNLKGPMAHPGFKRLT
jgi:glutamate-1-semialdehyde 2,1-aminomutase